MPRIILETIYTIGPCIFRFYKISPCDLFKTKMPNSLFNKSHNPKPNPLLKIPGPTPTPHYPVHSPYPTHFPLNLPGQFQSKNNNKKKNTRASFTTVPFSPKLHPMNPNLLSPQLTQPTSLSYPIKGSTVHSHLLTPSDNKETQRMTGGSS